MTRKDKTKPKGPTPEEAQLEKAMSRYHPFQQRQANNYRGADQIRVHVHNRPRGQVPAEHQTPTNHLLAQNIRQARTLPQQSLPRVKQWLAPKQQAFKQSNKSKTNEDKTMRVDCVKEEIKSEETMVLCGSGKLGLVAALILDSSQSTVSDGSVGWLDAE